MTAPQIDPAKIDALIEQVQGLTGPDREVDGEIALALGHSISWLPSGSIRNANGGPVITWHTPHPYAGMREPCPCWTASLDAVVALVEQVLPYREWSVGFDHEINKAWGRIADDVWDESFSHFIEYAPTPALALLLALFLALKDKANG